MISFSCSGRVGDCISWIPCMLSLSKGNPFTLYLKVNVPSPERVPHPCGFVLMDSTMSHSLITLLEIQPYIEKVSIWQGEDCIEIDSFRYLNFDFRQGDCARLPCLTHLCNPDFSKEWIHVKSEPNGKVLLNKTQRYGDNLDWRIIKKLKPSFVGFDNENVLDLPHIQTPTCLHLAKAIAGCNLFIGNQSLAFNIAQAVDKERALIVCPRSANVIPSSTRGQSIFNQSQLEEYINSR